MWRALPVVFDRSSRSSKAAVLTASLPRTAASTFARSGSTLPGNPLISCESYCPLNAKAGGRSQLWAAASVRNRRNPHGIAYDRPDTLEAPAIGRQVVLCRVAKPKAEQYSIANQSLIHQSEKNSVRSYRPPSRLVAGSTLLPVEPGECRERSKNQQQVRRRRRYWHLSRLNAKKFLPLPCGRKTDTHVRSGGGKGTSRLPIMQNPAIT
jgi:hypothetical protein